MTMPKKLGQSSFSKIRTAPNSLNSFDAVIVFGAAVWPGGRPSPALERRILHAVSLVKAGLAVNLLATGGLGKHPPSEAAVMRRTALDAGIPAHRIFTEETGTSTFHSALECLKIARARGWSSALIVTDVYHIPRAVFVFRGLGLKARGHPPPGGRQANRAWRWFLYHAREMLAFPWYCILVLRRVLYFRRI